MIAGTIARLQENRVQRIRISGMPGLHDQQNREST